MTDRTVDVRFAEWFAEQKAKGLVDMKLVVSTHSADSVRDIKSVILAAEDAIANDETQPLPQEGKVLPQGIQNVFAGIALTV
ncbi:hypothetical protein AGMMS49545_19110 [Betaproteobacteria bacterium]|nr:hypothetical protein AGMMS49545_19110 [Betaproteobacteria bacterium]